MTELIACLSTGKGTWGHVSRLLEDEQWTKVYLLTNEFGKENFTVNEKTELLTLDLNKGLKELRDDMHTILKEKIKGAEVALNVVSGTGKEHMALVSAVLKLGVGLRLVALTQEGVEEL
jgi:hypothetical protein